MRENQRNKLKRERKEGNAKEWGKARDMWGRREEMLGEKGKKCGEKGKKWNK